MVKNNKLNYIFMVLLAIILVAITGCTAQAPKGWSGCSVDMGNIYYGSTDSKIVSINPDARKANLSFPHRESNEWYFLIRATAPSGMCGPACGQPTTVGTAIYTTPAIGNELIYIATYNGKLYAFNKLTGSERWVYPRESIDTLEPIVGNLALDSKYIYCVSDKGVIYKFDQATGDKMWDFKTNDKIWTAPVIKDGVIYVASYNGILYAITEKGSELWRFKMPAAISSSPVILNNLVIMGSFDNYLYALNLDTKEIMWKIAGKNWFWAEVLIHGTNIFAANLDHSVYSVDAETGNILWKTDVGGPVSAKPVITDDKLITVTEKGNLSILDIITGHQIASINLNTRVIAQPAVINGMVFVKAQDNYIYAVDISKNEIAWKFKAKVE